MEMLRCFTTVVTQGNLGDAAAALRRTPSAVSMMLKQFEDHVGAPLFETGRKSRLTPLGALIYDEARREVAHFDTTLAAIEGIARAKQGHLRLAVIPSVATAILPEVVAEYIRDFPDIQIDVRDMDSAAIAVELAAGRADVGIGTLPDAPDMTRETLFSDVFGVVCTKAILWRRGKRPSLGACLRIMFLLPMGCATTSMILPSWILSKIQTSWCPIPRRFWGWCGKGSALLCCLNWRAVGRAMI